MNEKFFANFNFKFPFIKKIPNEIKKLFENEKCLNLNSNVNTIFKPNLKL